MEAAAEMYQAFRERADGVALGAQPLVGLFGDGIPEALVSASDARPVDVKAPPLADGRGGPIFPAVSAVVERFMDDFATRFLHRLAAGAFDKFDLIVFARDDVAALTAYQYAQELRRQGAIPDQTPRFHLWNFIHTDSDAAEAFNRLELDRLTQTLCEVSGTTLCQDTLAEAVKTEKVRATILDQFDVHDAETFVWRNAGRWMTAGRHVELLREIPVKASEQDNRRIGLVGTACDLPVLHEVCGSFGTVVADLQPYGQVWPANNSGPEDTVGMLRHLARYPLHIRTNPPGRYTDMLIEKLAGCDLVVSSVDRNDDSFGWEVPVLRQRLAATGTTVVDLGFRPFRPGPDWIETAREAIQEALQ